jgi:hypothetical protein
LGSKLPKHLKKRKEPGMGVRGGSFKFKKIKIKIGSRTRGSLEMVGSLMGYYWN